MSGAEGREYDRGGRKPGMGVFLELLTGMRKVGVGVVKPVGNQVSTYLGGNFESDRSSFTVIRGLSDMQYLRVFFGRRGAILFFPFFWAAPTLPIFLLVPFHCCAISTYVYYTDMQDRKGRSNITQVI